MRQERRSIVEGATRSLLSIIVPICIVCALMIPATADVFAEADVGYLKVRSSPSVPTIISVNGIPMDGWEIKKVPLPAGTYTVSFTDVPGYVTPAPIEVVVVAGDTTTVVAGFAQLGMLRVVSEPAVKTTISVDGIPRDDYGLWLWVEPGMHTVSFGPVEGYDPPPDQRVRARAGDTTVVTGVFTPNPDAPGPSGVGLLRVTSSPELPTTVSVDGVARNTWGLAWLSLPPGTYEVSFSDVGDHATPAPVTVQVKEGETATVTGTFTLLGGLRAVTTPPNAATIYVDDIPRDTWGVWLVLPEGWYTVSFGPVPGHDPLPSKTVLVVPGQTVLVVGEY